MPSTKSSSGKRKISEEHVEKKNAKKTRNVVKETPSWDPAEFKQLLTTEFKKRIEHPDFKV